ncbi:MFS transporter [Demequina sp. B12]|uniref:MFS transporter n=1 Tax=Demequina sp. B12 TaxID=2992757 RepID=UPI00237A7AFC|nr:MFS transporter [Demequina sp. B12]MDE0572034.1 MFS transporter [Demequina sp. B12]
MEYVLSPYRSILSRPGAKSFAFSGLLSRVPMSMFNISFILMVQIEYGSYEMAGRVAAIGILFWALQTVPTSRLADRIGQRAAMIPLAMLHVVGAVLGVWAAINQQPEWVLWIAVILASCQGPLGSLTRARWSHMLKSDEDIHTAFALEGALDEVLFISGPALATILATTVWPAAGLVVSTSAMVVGLTILLSQRATEPPARRTSGKEHTLGLRIPRTIIAVTFVALGLGVMFGAVDISVVAFAEEMGHKGWSGLALGVIAFGSFVGGLFYGTRHWKTPLWKRLIIGTAMLAIGMTVLTFSVNLVMLAVIGFLAGIAIAPTITNCDTAVQRVVKRDQITEGMGWLRIGQGVGVSFGAWAGGYLVDHLDAQAGLFLAAGAAIAMMGIAVLTAPVVRKGTERPGIAAGDDAEPPSMHGADDWVDTPPIAPNV